MIRALELENYKAFGTRARVEFAPITLRPDAKLDAASRCVAIVPAAGSRAADIRPNIRPVIAQKMVQTRCSGVKKMAIQITVNATV